MMGFKSAFQQEMRDYLTVRKHAVSPGTYRCDCATLRSFDCYLVANGADGKEIGSAAVHGWMQSLCPSYARSTFVGKVSSLRKFLEYLRYSGFTVFLPRCPKLVDTYSPYIFSDAELEKIFRAADSIRPAASARPYMHLEIPMLLRLLYCCGLRLGEALALQVKDVHFQDGTILIRNAKNKKQRIVPVDWALAGMLGKYCLAMDLACDPENCLFPGRSPGKPLSKHTAWRRFRRILEETGIYTEQEAHTRGQCLHCFRHLFAIRSFAQAERNGRPVDDSVPYLSIYLGHDDMNGTEKYLKFSSDMFPEYNAMFESYAGEAFSEVSYGE